MLWALAGVPTSRALLGTYSASTYRVLGRRNFRAALHWKLWGFALMRRVGLCSGSSNWTLLFGLKQLPRLLN